MMDIKIAFSSMELPGKIPPGSPIWKEFNASFENMEIDAPTISFLIDEGRAFTTWHGNNWRDSDNFICGQHIGLDFDSSGIDTVLRDPFIQKYASILYATPSSTPENPRCRALFLLDTPIMQAANYGRAAAALIWLFGETADRQCKDAVRFFYGSLASMPTRLDNILPLTVLRQTIANHEAALALKPVRPPSKFAATTPDAIEAEKLIARISPARADDYEEWVNIGMALQAGIGDQGLSLWDQWSARSPKYNAGECERKWKSFKPNGKITFATLGYFAQQDSPR